MAEDASACLGYDVAQQVQTELKQSFAELSDDVRKVSSQTITHDYHPASSGRPAYYLTMFRNGDKSPGGIRRVVGGDSTSVAPPKETLGSFQSRTGASVIINASGWWGTDRLMGLSIKDGTLVQGWEPSHDLGSESCVIMHDGELRVYTRDETPDPDTIIAEGGHNSFSWGAAVYRDGEVTDFRTKYSRYSTVSARQCVGSTLDGHVFFLTIPGVTRVSGARGDDIVAVAQDAGLDVRHLYVLDGGGSAQTMIGGEYLVPSSDATPRPVPDALYVMAPVSSPKAGGVFRFLRTSGEARIPHGSYTTITTMVAGPGDQGQGRLPVGSGVATIKEAGIYRIEGQVFFPSDSRGSRYVAITLNGSNRYRAISPAGQTAITVPIGLEIGLNAGDTVELQAYQNTGSAMNLPSDADGTRLSFRKVQ